MREYLTGLFYKWTDLKATNEALLVVLFMAMMIITFSVFAIYTIVLVIALSA